MQPSEIVSPLLEWFDLNKRDLPWRQDIADPQQKAYRVWISEIMLQQTRVEAVKPYFENFLKKLPTVEKLSEVPDEELMKLWEGLGYYSRARNLKKAAGTIMTELDGMIPTDYDNLMCLSGIGPYTAGAISSIAFGKKAPAVDGNVLRVVTRLTADSSEVTDAKVKKRIEALVTEWMPKERCGDFNQALMELGATVCVPNGQPSCAKCPWQGICMAHAEGNETDYPVKAAKKKRIVEPMTVLIVQDGKKTLIHKRENRGLLAGLFEFPNLPGHISSEEALSWVCELGLSPLYVEELDPSRHIFSHKEWEMKAYRIKVSDPAVDGRIKGDSFFVDTEDAQRNYAIPSAFSAYTKYLNIRTGKERFD